ncbi:MAG: HAMP domain-containing histidine kinase [Candidatus Nealsonbacteria bacterium]|nr:HAMP domain-containing histidine kinase [Candidatus Nealsonbacteria bacterium]
MEQDIKPQASFPVFMKLLVVFIIFGVLPLLAISWLFLSDYNAALKSAADMIGKNPEQVQEKIIEIQHIFRIRLGFFAIFFLTSISAGVLFSARILVRPLSQLLSGVRLLIKGQYGVKITVKSNDEYAIFADYFNEMSRQLKMTIEREKKISQMKSEFITLAAHQLRTPLSAIKWTIQMLIDGDIGKLNAEQKKVLENGYHANENIIRLTRDLLDVVRIEEGKFDYNFEYADPEKIIEKTIEEQKIIAEKKNIQINFEKSKEPFPKIKMDIQKIKLALGNLLTNAVNYTLPGGLVNISVVYRDTNYIEIKILDTGIGIPKSQMPRLFARFSRGENAMRLQTEGSGLGLFISRNIIKSHGGEIKIESEEGKGTTVYFTLPLLEKLIPEKPEAFEEFITGG